MGIPRTDLSPCSALSTAIPVVSSPKLASAMAWTEENGLRSHGRSGMLAVTDEALTSWSVAPIDAVYGAMTPISEEKARRPHGTELNTENQPSYERGAPFVAR